MSTPDAFSHPAPAGNLSTTMIQTNAMDTIDRQMSMESITNGVNGMSPLRSVESLDAYCNRVQERLFDFAAKRVNFLKDALERLTSLHHAARAIEDHALAQELYGHVVAVKQLLETVSRATGSAPARPDSASAPTLAPPAKPLTADTIAPTRPPASGMVSGPSFMPPQLAPRSYTPGSNSHISAAPPMGSLSQTSSEPAPRLPRRPLRPLADIESDAIALRTHLREWVEQHPLLTRYGELCVTNCLTLRSIACKQRRLAEEAGDTEVAEVSDLRDDILRLMDDANDHEYTIALDDDLDPRPTAYQWGEMSERYEEMAKAQEAFEWWQKNRNSLSIPDVQPLAEAIAAVQQRFNRILFRVGARDPFQQALFDELRVWAREAQCFLQSLRPKVPTGELIERSAMLDSAWNRARELILDDERRTGLIDRVISIVSDPRFGSSPETDEPRLQDAVWECRQNRVAASDRRLRDALLPWSAYLETDDRLRDVLREINFEWERRQDQGRAEEAAEQADQSLTSVLHELDSVREITRGKRCLILGGTVREENRRAIEEALELAELIWPSTKPSEPLAKYETEINHSDIVALIARFSRREWRHAQDICDRDGKTYVSLISGYAAAQVVHQIYKQLGGKDVRRS